MSEREDRRLAKLKELIVPSMEPEPEFDRLARLASHIVESPASWICFHDKTMQRMKSVEGADLPRSIERAKSLCTRVIDSAGPIQIFDLDEDDSEPARCVSRDLGFRSYAAVPITADGEAIGVVGTLDRQPKSVDAQRERMLWDVADLVVTELRLRKYETRRAQLSPSGNFIPSASRLDTFCKHFTRERIQVLRAIKDAIIAVNRAGLISFLNPAAERMLRRPADTLVGRPFDAIRHLPEFASDACLLRRSINEGEERIIANQKFIRGDSTVFPVEIICSPFHVGGQLIGSMLICRDASESPDIQGLSLQTALKEIERLKQHIARSMRTQQPPLQPFNPHIPGALSPVARQQQMVDLLSRINASEIEQIMRAMSLTGNVLEGPLGAAAMLNMSVSALRERLTAIESAKPPKKLSRVDRWTA